MIVSSFRNLQPRSAWASWPPPVSSCHLTQRPSISLQPISTDWKSFRGSSAISRYSLADHWPRRSFFPVNNNRTVAGEALRAGKVDFVLTGPSEYAIFQSRVKLTPVVAFSRPDYFSAIIVRQDSGIKSVAELKGKRMAFAAVGSTSAIGPSLLLAEAGLNPTKDVEPVHLSSSVGYTALKRGDVAAWGMAHYVYTRLRDADAEINSGTYRVVSPVVRTFRTMSSSPGGTSIRKSWNASGMHSAIPRRRVEGCAAGHRRGRRPIQTDGVYRDRE